MIDAEMTKFIKRVVVTTLIILGAGIIIYFSYLARKQLMWIGVAAFLGVAINPLVYKVKRFMPKKNLTLATLTILLIITIILCGLVWIFFAPSVQQTVKLITEIPTLVNKASTALSKSPLSTSTGIDQQSLKSFLESNSGKFVSSISYLVGLLLAFFQGIIDAVIAFITIISLMFFMTVEGSRLKSFSLRLVDKKHRDRFAKIGREVYDIINGYVVGNFIVSMIFGFLSAVVLWISGSPYFLVLALLAGLIDLIPLVGTTIAAILITIVSVLTGQPWVGVIFIIYSIVYVQLENAVINPAVYSNKVSVSPLIVLVSILIGAAVAGILGALVAIPVAATLRVLVKEIFKNRLQAG